MVYMPKIFIGSSGNAKTAGYPAKLAKALKTWAEPCVWGPLIFSLTEVAIESLEKLKDFDACIFFLTADDITLSKSEILLSPRDNVVFEIGLSMGLHGRSNTFIIVEKDAKFAKEPLKEIKLPSDWFGMTCAFFDPSTHNLESQFKEISKQIFNDIKINFNKFNMPLTKENLSGVVNALITEPVLEIKDSIINVKKALNNHISFISGAHRAGIVNIFPNRYSTIGEKSLNAWIESEFERAVEDGSTISIMGISLGDYFLDRGYMHKTFIKILPLMKQKHPDKKQVRALIVDPKCDALLERARLEVADIYMDTDEKRIDFHENMDAYKDSTTYIETDGAARIAQRICKLDKVSLEAKFYSQAPTCFLFLTNRYAFVENYTYASRGSSTPIIQIEKGIDTDFVKLYELYEQHFENIWKDATSIGQYKSYDWPIRKIN
jgi:hypothetical protein